MKRSFQSAGRLVSKSAIVISIFILTLAGQTLSQQPLSQNELGPKVKKDRSESKVVIAPDSITPPGNDNFGNASLFNTDGGSFVTTNVGATGEAGEPYHGAGRGANGQAQNNSIWFKYNSPITKVVTITISPIAQPDVIIDSVVSAYTGSAVNALTPVAENDDYPGLGYFSRITFTAAANQTYYIAVDGYGAQTGSFAFQYHTGLVPYNDNFANAQDLTEAGMGALEIPLTQSNQGATAEAGEPMHDPSGSGSNNSIWFKWTPPQSRCVTFDFAGSAADTVVAVYTGAAVNALTLVGQNDDFGPSGSRGSRVTFYATAGVTYYLAIDGYLNAVGNSQMNWGRYVEESGKRFDFDGDERADISIFRPSNGQWWINRSVAGVIANTFGNGSDLPTPADFTGDGKVDIAVFRPSTGEWFILRSEDSSFYSIPFGTSGDIPVPGRFDNDQSADIAVFRPSNATWYIRKSRSSQAIIQQFGVTGDVPVPADYDGDGYTDIAIYRPSNGQWWLNRSFTGVIALTFGTSTDKPTVGDYTGDGRTDIAFWRPSTGEWYTLRSEDYSYYSNPFGASTDIPAPGDYTGDRKFDQAVFRPSTGRWYVNASSGFPTTYEVPFGVAGDRPVENSYIH